MTRSVSIKTRKRQPLRHPLLRDVVEERPVLQLPLEPPQWREPPSKDPRQERQDGDRGVSVVDFFI